MNGGIVNTTRDLLITGHRPQARVLRSRELSELALDLLGTLSGSAKIAIINFGPSSLRSIKKSTTSIKLLKQHELYNLRGLGLQPLEDILPSDPQRTVPVCTGGRGAAPGEERHLPPSEAITTVLPCMVATERSANDHIATQAGALGESSREDCC